MLTLEPQTPWPKALAYAALDALTMGRGIRRTICGEAIRFPARWCRYYPTTYEPDTFAFLRRNVRPGAIALDIGAHIGLFSVVLSRLAGPSGHVFSFEPTPYTRDVLRKTIGLNGCEQVTVQAEAVSADTGEKSFYDTGVPGSNANSLVAAPGARGAITVPTVSVDEFVAERSLVVRCIKIDAEGAELAVMQGAVNTIRNDRPAVSLAVHPHAIDRSGGSLAELWEHIAESGLSPRYGNRTIDRAEFVAQAELFDVQLDPR